MHLFSGLPTAASGSTATSDPTPAGGPTPARRGGISGPPILARLAPPDARVPDPLAAALEVAPLGERGWRAPGAAALTHRDHPGVLAVRTRRGCLVVSGDTLGAGSADRRALIAEARGLAYGGGRELVATGLDPDAAGAWAHLGFRTVRSGASIRMAFNGGRGSVPQAQRRPGSRDAGVPSLDVLPLSWEGPLRGRLGGTVPRRALEVLMESAAHSGDLQGAGPVILVRRGRRLVAAGRIWRESPVAGAAFAHGAVHGRSDGEAAVHLFWCSRWPGTAAAVTEVLAHRAASEGVAAISLHLHGRRLGPLESRRIRELGGDVQARYNARSRGLAGILAARLA